MSKIKVLVVDDSAVVRQALSQILQSDPGIEVMDTAADPYIAADKMRKEAPDVIMLDIEMPRMDGLTFLKKIMEQHPIPVVVCSSLAEKGCVTTLKALEYGAVDIITKPKLGLREFFEESRILICDSVRAAAQVNTDRLVSMRKSSGPPKKLNADAVLEKRKAMSMIKTTEKICVMGASTGGTEALRIVLERLPVDAPGIAIVQHMPEKFTTAFAERLNSNCEIEVKEARDGDSIGRGRALIAPGNYHLLLKRSGARYFVEVRQGPLVNRHRPSVDVLFRSAAQYAGSNAIGVIMTGMGDDGASGMLEMREAGAFTMAQDSESSVVFGMPNEAIKRGGVSKIVTLNDIAGTIMEEYLKDDREGYKR